MLSNFAIVGTFVVLGILFALVTLGFSWILQPSNKFPEKLSTYECGELPQGDSWVQYNNRFYVIALIFLVFDVEVVFMFPWGVVFKSLGWYAYVEMVVFMLILIVGLAYAWVKGDLDWVKRLYDREQAARLVERIKKIG
jgi:NADH-quinone oxidoreductase subunit A